MRHLLTLLACLFVTGIASAQLPLEDFDSGTWPPAGWTVVDNIGNGNVWNTSSYWGSGNLSGGSGECAVMDDDAVGPGQRTDTELITPLFDIPGNHYYLEFDHHFKLYISGDHGDVDISIAGGPWTNLKTVSGTITQHEKIYLDAYAGATGCQLRFRYDDGGTFAYYWHVDNVEVVQGAPPVPPIWEEDFDSGVWPPVGWTVIDNVGNGNVWSTSSFWPRGNLTAGSGECATIDEDAIGPGQRTDTELISPPFDIPAGFIYLEYFYNFYGGSPEVGDVDISVGGGPWTNLESYSSASSGKASINLEDYTGSTGCQLRFRYDDGQVWGWYFQVDEVAVVEGDPPPTPIWEEDFDGGTWPPTGWTVIDNVGNGNVWNTSSTWPNGNLSGGTGECAAIDDDLIGSGNQTDTELITPAFDVPSSGLLFMYTHLFYDQWVAEQGLVDISVSGGPWINLATYLGPATGRIEIDMDPYVGSNVQIRFRYDDQHSWGYYWHVDDVGLYNPNTEPGTAYCFGDLGVDAPCPCANDNDGSVPGSGCANGVFASGAKLTGSGMASLSADTLVLATTGLEPSNSGLYFQANNDLSPGNVWGDGLQCAGGQLKRLGVRFADGTGYSDTSGYPQPISVKAGNILAGDTKYYQCWYRNPNGSPCATEFNASNGYAVIWLP